MSEFLFKALQFGPPLIIAVMLHEIAHGYVAYRLGDPTARALGRLSLNPLRHIDPVMTLLLPAVLIALGSPIVFGGAKPVPINPLYFKNPRRGMVWVALAGPVTNLLIGAVCIAILHVVRFPETQSTALIILMNLIAVWLIYSVLINAVLAAFNLVPIPPLDGGRVAVGLLPRPLAILLARLEPYGLLIVFALLSSGWLDRFLNPVVRFAVKSLS